MTSGDRLAPQGGHALADGVHRINRKPLAPRAREFEGVM